ncbi:MAG TPA: F0F1 ATP synthase subunit delta [Hyphomicrobiales bacterium]|nr:F0F1 ATP synthase subunit delta [Hyphomicrobiales bacterium]
MSQLTTYARPYARAAFETAVAAASLDTWSKGLALLVALTQQDKVAAFLAQPTQGWQQQAQGLVDLAGSELDPKLQNFVQLLASNKRLELLPEIAVLFEALKAESERTVDVDVTSAFAMDASAEQALAAALKTRLQREVKLSTQVDPSLIGGLIVRAGDLVIDGSVRGKLNKLSETMNA